MALVNATLTVNFDAAYPCTRVCWSTNPLGPFDDCLEDTFVVGDPGTFEIPIQVDPESCDPVTYYGYLQSCCEELGSVNGRVTWNATYTPTPTCTPIRFRNNTNPSLVVMAANICTTGGEIFSKDLGVEFVLCYEGGLTGTDFITDRDNPVNGWLVRGYTFTDDSATTCCSTCNTVTVSGTGTFQYVSCAGVLTSASVSGTPIQICAQENSWSSDAGFGVTFVVNAATCTLP